MTTAIKTGAIHQDWGVITCFDDDKPGRVVRITPIIEHYSRFPKHINSECLRFIKQRGRGVEKTIIRPAIKRLLMDFYLTLEAYAENISNFLEGEKPLEIELTGLELEVCLNIVDECTKINPNIHIYPGCALFGAILKEFYLSVDNRFLPDDFKDIRKTFSKNYYLLGEAMASRWHNDLRTPAKRYATIHLNIIEKMAIAQQISRGIK